MKLNNTSIKDLVANAEQLPLQTVNNDYKPNKLFIYTDFTKPHSMLECAILADLGYWFATKGVVWRKYSDWVDWFNVSESTIKRAVKHLDDLGYFERNRTTFTKRRGLGSYEFKPKTSKASQSLVAEYKPFINRENIGNDLIKGEIVDNELNDFISVNVANIPKFQILNLCMVEEVGTLRHAYLLSRLCWLWAKYGEQTISFESKVAVAHFTGLKYHPLLKQLQELEQQGNIVVTGDYGQLFITVTQRGYDACEDLINWLLDLQEKRNFGLEKHIDATRENSYGRFT